MKKAAFSLVTLLAVFILGVNNGFSQYHPPTKPQTKTQIENLPFVRSIDFNKDHRNQTPPDRNIDYLPQAHKGDV
ncbi:MAG: hypothetical protein Q8M08_12295 [Bacteroidales bacterium]|nr:hypothetical protein [Bacteroidales bacterium]